jgi:hypothetical protein
MRRYSSDRDPDGDRVRDERGSQARSEDRFSQGAYRSSRSEFSGRREPDQERDRFEQPYGRGDAHYGGRDDEDYRAKWNEHGGRTAWQPARASMGDPRRSQYGETDYGVYGPHYGSGYPGDAIHGGDVRGYGHSQYAGGYGYERGDDRYGRQGYGQSEWHQEYEREQHRFDPDYLQWRAEQIRNLDNDYFNYRRERYKKFSEEFDAWRRNRASSAGGSASRTAQETSSQDSTESARDPLGTPRTNK